MYPFILFLAKCALAAAALLFLAAVALAAVLLFLPGATLRLLRSLLLLLALAGAVYLAVVIVKAISCFAPPGKHT